MNHKFGDSIVLAHLRGGSLSSRPCPDHPRLRPHLQRSPQALPASQTRSHPQAWPPWPLPAVISCLLSNLVTYILVHLELYPVQAIREGPQRRWCISRWLLILLGLLRCLALRLPVDAVLLDEGFGNGRPNDLARGDGHSVELVEPRDQSWEPQGLVGPLWVHRVSRRRHPCKLINGIRNQLSHVDTHLCQSCGHWAGCCRAATSSISG